MTGRKVFPEMVSVGTTEPAIEFLTESVDAMLGDQFYFRQLHIGPASRSIALAGASREPRLDCAFAGDRPSQFLERRFG